VGLAQIRPAMVLRTSRQARRKFERRVPVPGAGTSSTRSSHR
jgi:hypothetical protein